MENLNKKSIVIFFLTFFSLLQVADVYSQEAFKIVYSVRPYAICSPQPPFDEIRDSQGISWLEHIKKDFHATGVKLFIDWSLFPNPKNVNLTSTQHLIKTIKLIKKHKLDLYVAVKLNSIPGFILKKSSKDLFQRKFDGKIAVLPNVTPMWDFANYKARQKMANYYKSVLELLSKISSPREVIPTFTWDAEMEFEHRFFTGYSDSMQAYFRRFLKERYKNSLEKLNLNWSLGNFRKSITSFDEIIVEPQWGNPKNHYIHFKEYPNSVGRLDWLHFRTYMLKRQYDFFKAINNEFGYKMPIQIGCTFDDRIERRGWTDITPLLKDADGIRVADIPGREESFAFQASFLKSLMDYWRWVSEQDTSHPRKSFVFSSEVNYPGYQGFTPSQLTSSWSKQVRAYYKRGADALFIHGWYKKNDKDFLLKCMTSFQSWLDTLGSYRHRKIKKLPRYKESVHFSSARTPILHGHDSQTGSSLENFEALYPFQSDYQYITDYMITESPEFLNQFSKMYFTSQSEYMKFAILKSLLSHKIKTKFEITTFDSSLQRYSPVPGFRNEMDLPQTDLKVNFVWRTSKELQVLFPSGNKCDSLIAKKSGWPLHQDFIDWCVLIGNQKYHEFNIDYLNWNSKAFLYWAFDPKLHLEFSDGYHSNIKKDFSLLDALINKAKIEKKSQIFLYWPFLP